MKNNYLTAIGANTIDEYYEMNVAPVLGDKVLINYLEKKVGGMIGNAASVYSNYGNATYILDHMRDEDDTKLIIDDLNSYGVNTDQIVIEEIETKSKCLIMLYEGERIIFVQENSRKDIELSDKQMDFIANGEFIYSTVKDLKRYSNTLDFIDELTSKGCKLCLDIEANTLADIDFDVKVIKKATHIFVNDFGDEYLKKEYSKDYINEFMESGVETIVITKGEEGCDVYSLKERFSVDGLTVDVIDTTGAGDTFNSSFIHGLLNKWELDKCAIFANAAAARAIQFMGAKSGAVDEEDVWNFIETYKGEKNEKI